MKTLLTIAVAVALGLPAVASAQLASLDRQGPGSAVQIQLDTIFDSHQPKRETYNRLDVYGQYALGTVGLYAAVPIAWTEVIFGDDQFVLGNVEVGAIYSIDLPAVSLTAHAGVALPTLSETVQRGFVSLGRLTDYNAFIEHSSAIRLGLVGRIDAGLVFAQADLGLDYALGDDVELLGEDTILRLNGAIGLGMPFFSVALESVNRGRIGSRGPSTVAALFDHTVSLTAIGHLGFADPYVSLLSPLDEGARGEDWDITIGVRIPLP